jgi:hypothetical protein
VLVLGRELAETGSAIFKEIALVVFFVVYMIILVRVLVARPGTYERRARLPLDDGSETGGAADDARRGESTPGKSTAGKSNPDGSRVHG